jgi:hypothetical protein
VTDRHVGRLLACVAIVLVVATTGCGGSSKRFAGGSTFARDALERDGDADNDSHGMGPYDNDGDALLTFGPAANALERQAITALLKRYYTVAAAGDGASACSLTYWLVREKIVEEHDHGRGLASLRGNTCAQVASKLFRQRHPELTEDVARFKVGAVQVRAKHGWAVLDFGPARERVTQVHREPSGWKMDALPDSGAL